MASMRSNLSRVVPRRFIAVTYGHFRSLAKGLPLPPGDSLSLFAREAKDRMFLAGQFADHGPIFRAYDWGNLWICIEGLERCRKFLRANAGKIRMDTMDIRAVVSEGMLRAMEGDNHKHYRRALVAAIASSDPLSDPTEAEKMIESELRVFAQATSTLSNPGTALRQVLERIATAILIMSFFGLTPDNPEFKKISIAYQRLGPRGLVWRPGAAQIVAYHELSRLAATIVGRMDGGILAHAARSGALDETLIGNMIYMVEMGRYDLAGLLCWSLKYLVDHPDFVGEMAAERRSRPYGERPLATAFARETLRSNQSERLTRYATEELEFEGYLIPRNARIRLCVWEAHKDPVNFPSPFEFQPCRFAQYTPNLNRYAPFGLDHHLCPFDHFTVRLCALFLGVLTTNWQLEKLDDGPVTRSRFHWTPSPAFAVRLEPFEAAPLSL